MAPSRVTHERNIIFARTPCKVYTNWHRKLPLRDMNKFPFVIIALLETDYKCVDYGRDSGYCKHCSEPTIVCTICTNQFFLIKLIKRRKSLKMISKMSFNKLNTNFRWEHYVRRKNRTAFLDVPFLLPETFHCNGKKSCVPFTFHPDFPELFLSV